MLKRMYPVVLDWFKSYMTGRNQSVKINGSLSFPLPLSFGVPQGSWPSCVYFIYTSSQ